jgi:hypothetical protein
MSCSRVTPRCQRRVTAVAERIWSQLSPSSRRRWIAAFGGPRRTEAAHRAELARLAYESGARLPADHTGHAGRYEVRFSQVVTTEGVRDLTVESRIEARRVGEHTADVALLRDGIVDAPTFRRRWRKRISTAGSAQLEADPDRVLVFVTEAGPAPEPFYRRSPLR